MALRYLKTTDPFELNLIGYIASEAHKQRERRELSLANKIANQVGQLFSKR